MKTIKGILWLQKENVLAIYLLITQHGVLHSTDNLLIKTNLSSTGAQAVTLINLWLNRRCQSEIYRSENM